MANHHAPGALVSCLHALSALLDKVPGGRALMAKASCDSEDPDDGVQERLYVFISGAVSCRFEAGQIRNLANVMLVSGFQSPRISLLLTLLHRLTTTTTLSLLLCLWRLGG